MIILLNRSASNACSKCISGPLPITKVNRKVISFISCPSSKLLRATKTAPLLYFILIMPVLWRRPMERKWPKDLWDLYGWWRILNTYFFGPLWHSSLACIQRGVLWGVWWVGVHLSTLLPVHPSVLLFYQPTGDSGCFSTGSFVCCCFQQGKKIYKMQNSNIHWKNVTLTRNSRMELS